MTSKERAELKAQAMKIDSIFQIGKSSLSPAQIEAIRSAFQVRELIKLSVLKNCADNPAELAEVIAERTGSQVVQVIGKKIVLYKKNPKREAGKNSAGKREQKRSGLRDRKKSAKAAGKGTARATGKDSARPSERKFGRAGGKEANGTGGARRGRSQGSERSRRNRAARHG